MTDFDHLTEPQQIVFDFIAAVEGKRLFEVRRDALAAYADDALRDPDMKAAVLYCLKHRREEGVGRDPVKLEAIPAGPDLEAS